MLPIVNSKVSKWQLFEQFQFWLDKSKKLLFNIMWKYLIHCLRLNGKIFFNSREWIKNDHVPVNKNISFLSYFPRNLFSVLWLNICADLASLHCIQMKWRWYGTTSWSKTNKSKNKNNSKKKITLYHRFRSQTGLPHLQSGPKVLDYWGVITNDFPRSPFSMLIHIVLARTPLLSATLKQGVGRGNCIWIQGLGVTIPLKNRQKINVSTVNGWMKLKRERRSNDFWPWLSERVSKYCI